MPKESKNDDCSSSENSPREHHDGHKCRRGPRGKKGSPGPPGPMGPKGDYGVRGDPGERGKRGKKGSPGPCGPMGPPGPRGHEGERGCHGHTGPTGAVGPTGPIAVGPTGAVGLPGASFAGVSAFVANTSAQHVAAGAPVQFDNVNLGSSGVDVANSGLTIQQPGRYLFDYHIRGSSDNQTPLVFGLRANGSVHISGTNFASADPVSASAISAVSGSSIVSFPDLSRGISTGRGTTVELQNVSTGNVSLGSSAVNASLRVLKI